MNESQTARILFRQLELVENDVVSLAEAMPAEHFDFVPRAGEFAGVRTFGEQIRHLATVIFLTVALVLEECSPYPPGVNNNGPDGVNTKSDVLAYLREAFAYARLALHRISETDERETVKTYFGLQTRAEVAAGIVYHSYNHYGQMVVYARLCGVVPPTSVVS